MLLDDVFAVMPTEYNTQDLASVYGGFVLMDELIAAARNGTSKRFRMRGSTSRAPRGIQETSATFAGMPSTFVVPVRGRGPVN